MKYERAIRDKEYQVLSSLVRQLAKFHPKRIILFGSYATENFKPGVSDIDICVVLDTTDKRKTLADIYNDIHLELPVDILLYTTEEWAFCIQDQCSFAYNINTTGLMLTNKLNTLAVPGAQQITEGEDKLEEFLSVKPNQKTIDGVRKQKG